MTWDAHDLYLSYSGRRSYLLCPTQYKFQYIDHYDRITDPKQTMFGSVIGKVFEWFYSRKIWSEPDVKNSLLSLINPAIKLISEKEKFDVNSDLIFMQSLRDELQYYITCGIDTIRNNKLLTPDSRAEVDLTIMYTRGITIKIGGRADFIHGDRNNTWIIDGKGSKYRDKYLDSDQLIWYALQYYLKYHIAPTRLGFVFWKFPEDPIQWIDYDNNSLRASLNLTFEIAEKIRNREFGLKLSNACKFCGFHQYCSDGREYVKAMQVESVKYVENSIFDLEQL